jgi:hypothetical protein
VAVVLLISIVILGGVLIFWMFQNNILVSSPARLSVDSSQLVRDTQGNVIFSITVKNSGTKACTGINVTLNGENATSYDLSTQPLEPGHTATFAPSLDNIYVLGNTYPATVTGAFSDGSSTAISQTVTCAGTGGYIEKKSIVFDSAGLNSSASGIVLTVDGSTYGFSSLPLSFNWLRGSTHSFTWIDSVATATPDQRFLWQSTNGLATQRVGAITVSLDGQIKATYAIFTTRSVTFYCAGAGSNVLKVDGTDYDGSVLPKTFYWANGSPHTFSWYSPVLESSGTRSIWMSTTGLSSNQFDTLTVTTSGDVNATYRTEYLLTVSISPIGGGNVDLASGTWFNAGTTVNATATPLGNFTFASWVLDSVSHSENPINLTFNSQHSLTAYFYSVVDVTFQESGIQNDTTAPVLTMEGGTHYYYSDLPKTFSWVVGSSNPFSWSTQVSDGAGKRYVWANSTGLSNASSGMILVAVGGGTVNAFYNTEYRVITNASAGGTIDIPGTNWCTSGTTLDITASPEPSYILDYWEVNGAPDGNATVLHLLVDAAYNVTAVFRMSTVSVTFDYSGLTGDASGTVLNVDSGLYTYTRAELPKTFDWIPGSSHDYYYSFVYSNETGKGFSLTNTTGSLSPIHVTGAETITGNYGIQYYLTVTSLYGTVGGQGWYDSGSSANATVTPLTVAGSSGTQYVFAQWSGDASGSTSPSNAITMDGPKNATADWKTQYYLTVSSDYGTFGGQGWYDNGSTAQATVTPLTVAGSSGTQHVFTQWSGDASGSTSPSDDITMSGPKTATASWKTQYHLTVSSDHGTVGGEDWYDSNSTAYATVTPLTVNGSAGTQYFFIMWSGGASGSTSPSDPITMDSPKTATATWTTRYELTFTQSGLDASVTGEIIVHVGLADVNYEDLPYSIWANNLETVTYSYVDTIWSSTEKQFILNNVTGPTSPITVNSTATVTGDYTLQWSVTFDDWGLDASATGLVVTVNGTPLNYKDLAYTVWADAGSNFSYTYEEYVASSTGPEERFHLTDVTGPISPITNVNSSISVTGNYIAQWRVTFDHSGLDSSASGTLVTVNGAEKTSLPSIDWYDQGSNITYTFADPVLSSTSGKQFRLINATGPSSPITVDEDATVTGNYVAQYMLTVTSEHDSPSPTIGEHWYDTGANVSASVTSPADESNGTRYSCVGYSGTGSVPSSGGSSSLEFNITEPSTLTWNWQAQYRVIFNQTGISSDFTSTVVTIDASSDYDVTTLPHTFWWDNSYHTFSFHSPLTVDAGKQYNWASTTGGLSIMQSESINVSASGNVTGNYGIKYYLTVTSPYGTAGGQGWYDSGATAYASLNTDTVDHGNGTRRVFTSWDTDTSGTNYTQSEGITMNGPKTATADWKTQYYVTYAATGNVLSVTVPSDEWVDSSGVAVGVFPSQVTDAGTRCNFVSDNRTAITEPSLIVGTYQTQYNVTFAQSGVGDDFSGNVMMVGGANYTRTGHSDWYDSGVNVSVSFYSPLIVNASEKYDFISANASLPYHVSGSATVTGTYAVSWQVTFDYANLDLSATGQVVTIASTPYTYNELPHKLWIANGGGVTYTYESSVASSTVGARFIFNSGTCPQSDSISNITSALTIVGNYTAQYNLTITITPPGSGYATPAAGSYWKDSGANVSVTATPLGNYRFDHWMLDGSNNGSASPNYVLMDGPHVLQAVFTETAGVTFNVSGIVSGYPADLLTVGGQYYKLSDLPLSFPTWDVGTTHSFVWIDPLYDGTDKLYLWSSTSGLATTRTGFINVTSGGGVVNAVYVTQYRLLISVANATQGTTSPVPGEYWYNSTSTATVNATANSGYAFDYWSFDGAANTTNPITVSMSTNHTLVANFMTAVFYKWSDGTTSDSMSLSYNLFNGTWTHDSNATYGIKSTGVYSTLNTHLLLNSISDPNVVENVTFIIRNGAGVEVARVTWATGDTLPTAPQPLDLATNVVYTIEVWIKGKATVSGVSVGLRITIP